MGSKKDFKPVIKAAEAAGWTVTTSRGGHLRWKSPSGALVFSAATPGDSHALANHKAVLRKKGLVL